MWWYISPGKTKDCSRSKDREFFKNLSNFHLQLLQNIDYIPCIVQYILQPILYPVVCTSHSAHLYTASSPCSLLVTTSLFSIFVSAFLVIFTQFNSVAQLCLTLQLHGLQHARPPCQLPKPSVYSNSCPLSRWCHPTISSSVIPFSSCLQSFPASGSFQMSQFFTSGGHKYWSFSFSINPSNGIFRVDFL